MIFLLIDLFLYKSIGNARLVCVGGGDRGGVGERYDSIKLRKLKLRIIDTIVNVFAKTTHNIS